MNNLFTTIFNSISNRIFGELETLNKDIHPDIFKIFKIARNKELDGKMFKVNINDLDIYVILVLEDNMYMDNLLVDNKKSVVCIMPHDLYSYKEKDILFIVKTMYKYICNQFITRKGDTMYNIILSIAPTILTLHTIRNICTELELVDFIEEDDAFKALTAQILYDSLSYNIQELLDYCGIMAICEEHLKKEVDSHEEESN